MFFWGDLKSPQPKANTTTTLSVTLPNRSNLRHQLRQQRRQLSRSVQRHAAQQLLIKVGRSQPFRRAKKIAFYWPNDGEISPLPLLHLAQKLGKQCFLPVVSSHTQGMTFRQYRRGDRLQTNQFGIPEPSHQAASVLVHNLDLVLLPLVAFDRQGNRLGMGGGFYDRAFAGLRMRLPIRLGLAHELQKVPQLDFASWDLPLHRVCTEKHFYYCS